MKKFGLAAALLFSPAFAYAHGVGQVYSLPIPLKYYLSAAGLAVALSFFLFALFLDDKKQPKPDKAFSTNWLPAALALAKWALFALLGLTIATGLLGSENSAENFAPIFFWVFFMVGMGLLSAIIGNIWDKINPLKILTGWIGNSQSKKISAWVGAILILGLFWFELSSGNSFVPLFIGSLLLFYAVVNVSMSLTYQNWYQDGELFSVLFSFIGRMAPLRIGDNNRSIIYQPLRNKLTGAISSWASLGIASILLAVTSFDSFKETVSWFKLIVYFNLTTDHPVILNTVGLILSPIPFLLFYLLAIWLMQKITKTSDWKTLAKQFIWSLIPIAFGYTLAHNFALIIVSLPTALGLISDPFGFGWDIFQTKALVGNSLLLGAKAIWFIEIGFIVAAHILGTLYAHMIAAKVMPKHLVARSQYPMLVLMVVFTVITLWLLSQPLVIGMN